MEIVFAFKKVGYNLTFGYNGATFKSMYGLTLTKLWYGDNLEVINASQLLTLFKDENFK